MDWESVGVVLSVRPFGEGDGVVTLLTPDHGSHQGLARGARSRSGRSTWETGNVLRVRWLARLADQLGTFAGEPLQSPSAGLFDRPLPMACLASACAVAAGALPERASHQRTFEGLVGLLAGLADGEADIPTLVRWEAVLLGELGYGLDLSRCAVTGAVAGLRYVSPRSGRAVSQAGAGPWCDKLLRLPAYMLDEGGVGATSVDYTDGLALTGHFLARDAFGTHHRGLPPARVRLPDMVARHYGSSGNVL